MAIGPVGDGDSVLLRGNNEATVQWVQRCRAKKMKSRSRALITIVRRSRTCEWSALRLYYPCPGGFLTALLMGSRGGTALTPWTTSYPSVCAVVRTGAGGGGLDAMYLHLGCRLALGAVAKASERTHGVVYFWLEAVPYEGGHFCFLEGSATVESHVRSFCLRVSRTCGARRGCKRYCSYGRRFVGCKGLSSGDARVGVGHPTPVGSGRPASGGLPPCRGTQPKGRASAIEVE